MISITGWELAIADAAEQAHAQDRKALIREIPVRALSQRELGGIQHDRDGFHKLSDFAHH
jgi:hypothetical protein